MEEQTDGPAEGPALKNELCSHRRTIPRKAPIAAATIAAAPMIRTQNKDSSTAGSTTEAPPHHQQTEGEGQQPDKGDGPVRR